MKNNKIKIGIFTEDKKEAEETAWNILKEANINLETVKANTRLGWLQYETKDLLIQHLPLSDGIRGHKLHFAIIDEKILDNSEYVDIIYTVIYSCLNVRSTLFDAIDNSLAKSIRPAHEDMSRETHHKYRAIHPRLGNKPFISKAIRFVQINNNLEKAFEEYRKNMLQQNLKNLGKNVDFTI